MIATGRAHRWNGTRVATVVTHELSGRLVIGQRDIAILAPRCPATRWACQHLSEPTPVLEENDLLASIESLTHGCKQLGRERSAHHLAVTEILDVDKFYAWQLHTLEALRERDESVFARESIVVGLNTGRGGA